MMLADMASACGAFRTLISAEPTIHFGRYSTLQTTIRKRQKWSFSSVTETYEFWHPFERNHDELAGRTLF